MKSRVHPQYKTKYRVKNWASYDRTLVRRGDITSWLSPAAIATWEPDRAGPRGAQRKYSDLAIESALTRRLLFHLPLRQAEGFLTSLFVLMGLDLRAPDHPTLSRRGRYLELSLRRVPKRADLHHRQQWAVARRRGGMGSCEAWTSRPPGLEEAPSGCRSDRRDRRARPHRGHTR